jgi:hypothetical protein
LEGATVGHVGTRDENLVPHFHRASGWIVGPDRQTITCLIAKVHTKNLIARLEDNKQFSLVVAGSTTGPNASVPPQPAMDAHECYQFKGTYLESRPPNEADLAAFRDCRERFVKVVQPLFGFTDGGAAAFTIEPGLAVTFQVREIFTQTPGPGAGRRIVPEEA